MTVFGRQADWKPVATVAGIAFPMFIVLTIFAIDFFEWSYQADEDFPVFRAFASFAIWSAVGLPLTFVGAARGIAD